MFSPRVYTVHGKLEHSNIIQSICILLFTILFLSCEQNINVEIKTNDRRLLVDGEFTSDFAIHSIRLYCSGSLITGQPQTVATGATINVTDGIETFDYIENNDTLGLYQTPVVVAGRGGHRYTLSIKNIDIDKDGTMDSFTATSLMPVPVTIDSLVSWRGLNADGKEAVNNKAYYKIYLNGPDYVYNVASVNNVIKYGTLSDRLGTGEINRFENEWKAPKVLNPGSYINRIGYYSISTTVAKGDTISFMCFNFTNDQYSYLKIFDNNTSSKDEFNSENIYDQLKIPTNLPTNIEPADQAAGYFFVYSISKIRNVFNK